MSPTRGNHRTFSDQVANVVVAVNVGIGVAAFREEPRDTSVVVFCAVMVALGVGLGVFGRWRNRRPAPPE